MNVSKAIEIIGGINVIGDFVRLVKTGISYLRSRNTGVQEQEIQEHEVLQLQSDLRDLNEKLPSRYNLLDRAEWRSHENCVAELLPKLYDAVYDAEDLLDEFRWYEIKESIKGDSIQESLIEFFRSVSQGSSNKVTDIQKRLSNLSDQLEKMGLHEATPRFDKSIRPVTTSFPTKAKIFGREKEIEEVVRLLGVPNSKRKRTCKAANNEPRAASVPVLPIVGMGGVGKTTLAQEITTLQRVKSHFDKIIWICVSDEFDAERLTKVLIKSLSGKEATTNHFDDLQKHLENEVGKKRFLLILDDIWPDALKDNDSNWRKFCAPLANALQGSMLLVTTRFPEVAATVGTKQYIAKFETIREKGYLALEGLKPEDFWELFKSCVSGYEGDLDPQLESIGRSIVHKLKGSPLAAMTIGRLLRTSLTTKHWNDILNNELWQLPQKETDILPALRLSYMYLPFHLKRCFSFCAVYPKDYNFEKDSLAEIWVAQGFVEPQGNIPLQHIGGQYFDDLVNLSFFQKLNDRYVIHDLIHDMAQLVSEDECFIVKDASDFGKVPPNVRHLSILRGSGFKVGHLASLRKHKKLRTLLCKKPSLAQTIVDWVCELQCLRVVSLASMKKLPENIGNLKHLRYLEISKSRSLKSLPSSICCLYNLQILYAKECVLSLPLGFSDLINLHKFEAVLDTVQFDALVDQKFLWLSNNRYINNLIINNLGAISKDHAAEMGLENLENIRRLSLSWSPLRSQEHIAIEVLEALHLPRNIKSMHLQDYPGEYLPGVTAGSSNSDRVGCIFPSLEELSIEGSKQLSSLEQFLQSDCVPAIKKIVVENCQRLSLKFGNLYGVEELRVCDCPYIISRDFFAPYLKKLILKESRNITTSVLNLEMWYLPAVQELTIIGFKSLTFTGTANLSHHSGSNSISETLSSLTDLTITGCSNMKNIDVLLSHECLPAINRICVKHCEELQYLFGGRFASLSSLEDLEIIRCPRLSGMVLPSSLKRLHLERCGSISTCFPRCLENLTSLQSLKIFECEGIVSIPGDTWTKNLPSLNVLRIFACPDLVSIGGPDAIKHIPTGSIVRCAKLEEIEQPMSWSK